MIGQKVSFKMEGQMSEEELREKLGELVDVFKKVPGLRNKYFLFDPKTGEMGGFYAFESQEDLDEYLKSDVWKNVIAQAKDETTIERFVVTAALDAGVCI